MGPEPTEHVSISQHKDEREEGKVVGCAELSGTAMLSAIWAEEALMAKAGYLLLASLVPNPANVKSPCFPLGSISFPSYHV